MIHRPALAAVLVAAALVLLPAAPSSAAGADGRAALPTKRVVDDRSDGAAQAVDATQVVLRSAPVRGRRASVVVSVPDGLEAGGQVVFHIDTDSDPTPEIAYFGGVSSEFQGYRMRSWTRTGEQLPLTCGRMSAAIDETRARLAFNPLCINARVRTLSVSVHLVAPDGAAEHGDWLPARRTFSGRVKAFVA